MKLRLAAIGLGAAVLCSATVATAAVLSTDGAPAAGPLTGTAEQTRTYYATARASLSPLIVHVRDLPEALQGLADGRSAPAGLRRQALAWAEDCANARDLVGRVPAPGGTAGAHVTVLYQSAAMLYTEAARLAAEAAAAPQQRRSDALLGQHLVEIGDRMFDSAYRLLNSAGALSASELRFPSPVPDFTTAVRSAAAPAAAPVGTPVGQWTKAHGADLRDVAAAVARALADPISMSAAELTQAQDRVADPIEGVGGQESLTGLRLATLILAEAGNRRGAAVAEDSTSRRLELLASRMWHSSAGQLPDRGLGRAIAKDAAPTADERALFSGGYFHGSPPPLKSGDDPGAGLPGGLPALDAQALLGS